MPYEIKPLSCDPKKLKGLSETLMVSHWENNYGGAVKRLNAITAQVAPLDFATAPVFVINGLKREELIATNSMILHELYFDGLGAEGEPDRPLRETLARDFGSVDRWRAEFVAMGKAMGGGSGWVLLTYSPRDRKLVNQWAADHTHSLAGGSPILALDGGRMTTFTIHVNAGGGIDRSAGKPFGVWGVIGELPLHPKLRVVGEVAGESVRANLPITRRCSV